MYFRNYRQSNTWLNHSLKSTVSERFSTVNMLKGTKHLWNLHESTFSIFFHHSEAKWFGKYRPYWSLKWGGCLLTRGLRITSTLFRIVRSSRSVFKSKYLKNQKYFLRFLFHLWNLYQILNIFKKKKIVIANVFPKLQNVKDLVRSLTEKRRVITSFDSQHVIRSQTLVKSSWDPFIISFHHSEDKWFGKHFLYISLKWYGCSLTHGLPITSFLFQIVRISCSLFKWNYLKNQNHFLRFLFRLWNNNNNNNNNFLYSR